DHSYPVHHNENKVSSGMQQITGYPYPDHNNWWVILPPVDKNDLLENNEVVSGSSLIRLMHVATGKLLMTHDVASPLTMTNMEVTAVEETDEARQENTLWRLQTLNNFDTLKS